MSAAFDRLQSFLDSETAEKQSLRILEAGCGSISYIRFKQDVHLVGIDISESQLEGNSRLDEKILGDIQYHDLPPSCFDVIVCVDVMEHLPEPMLALDRFNSALNTNGLIVMKSPNLLSAKGLLTKFTPLKIHKLAYKYMNKGGKNAKKSDIVPFKTYFRYSIEPNALKNTAREIGLETVYFDTYDITSSAWFQQKKHAHRAYRMIKAILKFASFNHIDFSEYILVLKKTL